jgi:hypothetical protein
MKRETNMYRLSVKQWSPFAGCQHKCAYCANSFQLQLKRWAKKNCKKCFDFVPHEHPDRLGQSLPSTGFLQFIFTCSSGDIAFCPTDYLMRIISRIEDEPDKTFLIQSKNPATFNRARFPRNVILGTTIETNRDDVCKPFAEAPAPSQRYADFLEVDHPLKMMTIEPVMVFDLPVMIEWVERLNPVMVWLGYDSKRAGLPEPELNEVKNLYWELGKRGFVVILKRIRDARHSTARGK